MLCQVIYLKFSSSFTLFDDEYKVPHRSHTHSDKCNHKAAYRGNSYFSFWVITSVSTQLLLWLSSSNKWSRNLSDRVWHVLLTEKKKRQRLSLPQAWSCIHWFKRFVVLMFLVNWPICLQHALNTQKWIILAWSTIRSHQKPLISAFTVSF